MLAPLVLLLPILFSMHIGSFVTLLGISLCIVCPFLPCLSFILYPRSIHLHRNCMQFSNFGCRGRQLQLFFLSREPSMLFPIGKAKSPHFERYSERWYLRRLGWKPLLLFPLTLTVSRSLFWELAVVTPLWLPHAALSGTV